MIFGIEDVVLVAGDDYDAVVSLSRVGVREANVNFEFVHYTPDVLAAKSYQSSVDARIDLYFFAELIILQK